jgi:hypothetical protein
MQVSQGQPFKRNSILYNQLIKGFEESNETKCEVQSYHWALRKKYVSTCCNLGHSSNTHPRNQPPPTGAKKKRNRKTEMRKRNS